MPPPSMGQGEGRPIKSHTFLLSLFLVLATILCVSISMFLCIYTYQNNAATPPVSFMLTSSSNMKIFHML